MRQEQQHGIATRLFTAGWLASPACMDTSMANINITKFDKDLKAVGIPIDGVGGSPDGSIRIDFKPTATAAQRQQAAAILAAHDPVDHEDEATKTREARAATLLDKARRGSLSKTEVAEAIALLLAK